MHKLLLLLFLIISTANASINAFKVHYYNDPSNKLTLVDIENKEFEDIKKNFSLGYKKGATWLKVDFYNRYNTNSFVLELNELFYEKAIFYEQILDTWLEKNYFLTKNIKQREIPSSNITFNFISKKNTYKTFYIKLESKYSHFGQINIYKKDNYIVGLKTFDYLYLLALISLIIAFIVAILIYYKQREKIYMYYMFYTLFLAIYVFKMSSFIVHVNLQKYIYDLHFVVGLAMSFFVLFSKEILEVKKHLKKISFLLDVTAAVLFFISIMMIFNYNPWNIVLNSVITFIFILFLPISLYTYKKGNLDSKYYFLVVFLYFLTIILYTLMLANILNYNIITRYSYLFIITLEIIAFTILIINKYNKISSKSHSLST